ncbi:MAG: 30S ribosomal protein S6 [Phycisphaerae bacterium]|nr:30S ribosomal protein S6 [Phycisphaerae bacterium]
MKTYEAMFLLDADNSDFESASAPVREVLERAGAEVLTMKPWDERRLAYTIKGRKRGLYILTYFKADPTKMDEMQHDIQLNDRLLRAIILSGDHVSDEQIGADTPATLAETRRVAAEAERAAKKEAEAIEQASLETADDETPTTPEAADESESAATPDEPESAVIPDEPESAVIPDEPKVSPEEQTSEEPDTTNLDNQT